MSPTPTTKKLRLAVAAGNYLEVEQLLVEYRIEVESEWMSASADQRRAIASEATSLLQWVRHTILAARSHAQHRHAQLARQSAYSGTPTRRFAVNIDG